MTFEPSAPQQEALWWIQQRSPRKDLYNLTWRMSVGPLDPDALRRAWQTIVDRHEALRTSLVQRDGAVWQYIQPYVQVELNELTWSETASSGIKPGSDLLDLLATHVHQRPFALDSAPLARLSLARVGSRSELLLTVHHAVLDGWSVQRLVDELATAYNVEVESPGGFAVAFTDEPVAFLEYSRTARQAQADGTWQRSTEFWVDRLTGSDPVECTTVVPDRIQPSDSGASGVDGQVLRYPLSAAARNGVQALTERGGMTPFAAYLAAMYTALAGGGAGSRVAVGVAVANRMSELDEQCVGYLTNVVIASGEVTESNTLDEVVAHARDDFWDSLPHQQVPFSVVHSELPVKARDHIGSTPAILVTYHGHIGGGVLFGDRTTQLLPSPSTSATNHFAFGIFEEPTGAVVEVEYDTTRFDETTVRRLLADVERVLEHGTSDGVLVRSIEINSRTAPARQVTGPAETAPEVPARVSEPADALEQVIGGLWRRALRADDAGPSSEFFALGGHSLQVFELMAEVHQETGGQIDIMEWLDDPTLGRLVELTREPIAEQKSSSVDNALLRTGTDSGHHLHLIHPAGGVDHAAYRDLAAALPESWRVTVSPDDDLETISEMADHYVHALLAGSRLPDMLGGWSLGGLIGYAMALRLRKEGITPPPLLLIDPPAPDGSSFDEGHSELDSFIYTILRGVGADSDLRKCAVPLSQSNP